MEGEVIVIANNHDNKSARGFCKDSDMIYPILITLPCEKFHNFYDYEIN